MEHNKVYAYFEHNKRSESKQELCLINFKTEAQIEKLCNPIETEEEKEEVEKLVKKTIIAHDVKTYFDDTPLNNKIL